MREVKFRAWHISGGRYVNYSDKTNFAVFDLLNDIGSEFTDCYCDIDFTIEQYTGFKDKNKTEIYEGDILKYYDNHIFKVVWGGHWEHCGFGLETNEPVLPGYVPFTWDLLNNSGDWRTVLEKIGNIHENPELIK